MTTRPYKPLPDRLRYLPVPAFLLGPWLRDVDSLAEAKVTLHVWRLLQERKSFPRFVRRSELAADRALLAGLQALDRLNPHAALAEALRRAQERGTLLLLPVRAGEEVDEAVLLNTERNQQLAAEVAAGRVSLGPFAAAAAGEPPPPAPRPTIYELAEQNIGLLTPLIADELRLAEATYPPEWIEDAFREAVGYNRRSWRYVRRILETWATRGKGDSGTSRRRAEPAEDSDSYLRGRYGHLLKR